MESSLHGVWESAVGNPFIPTIGKESQFVVGFSLLCIGVLLSGLFGLNRSALTLPLLGLPASAAIAAGSFTFKIGTQGIRFAVEESRVMQGIVFLDKALFTTFSCTLPEPDSEQDQEDAVSNDLAVFQISLSALLETLQIFGAADASTSRFSKPENDGYNSNIRRNRPNAFSNQALGLAGVCRFSYAVVILGSASVDFSKGRELLETFAVKERWSQSYRFDMVKAAGEAMRLASKVSIRGDEQGVLSLQFMVEVDGGGVSFVDFRFVPFIRGEDDEDQDNSQEDDEEFEEEGDDEQ
ncbi:hypothetical protein DID88_008651 [Monilinia fructigena]|uniref:Uncharacterized protein n=1 Tax=Monilinia fructigena TaxID=38457 RepID=A0A395J6P7_9HELO|nr:hypothetical protein DID88_008651 [Monilinia fructigena]